MRFIQCNIKKQTQQESQKRIYWVNMQQKDESSSPLHATLFKGLMILHSISTMKPGQLFDSLTVAVLGATVNRRSAHLHDELAGNSNLQQQLNVKQQNRGLRTARLWSVSTIRAIGAWVYLFDIALSNFIRQ